MNVGVLGSGSVGQALAGKLAELGHDVVLGTRDPANVAEKKGYAPSLGEWLATVEGAARLGTFAAAAAHGELIVNALNGLVAVETLQPLAAALAGKVMIDITNPLDFSNGFPPSLFVSNTDSLGEQIQRALPKTKVVKTLNTVNAFVMVDPQSLASGDHTMFVCGNDETAKATVTNLLREGFGWKDLVDLGDITSARATESLLPIWTRLYGTLKSGNFSFRLVRG